MWKKIVKVHFWSEVKIRSTGKSFSEALIVASTSPQYDKRLFIDLLVQHMKTTSPEQEQNMNRTWQEHVLRLWFLCTELVIPWTIYCHIECGLIDSKIRASDKDLPVLQSTEMLDHLKASGFAKVFSMNFYNRCTREFSSHVAIQLGHGRISIGERWNSVGCDNVWWIENCNFG